MAIMEQEVVKYKAYSKNIIWCLSFAGLWPHTHPVPKRIFSFISFFSTFAILMSTTNFVFQNGRNVILVAMGLCPAVSFSSVFSKVLLFLLHQDDLAYLNEHLTSKFMIDMEVSEYRKEQLSIMRFFAKFVRAHEASLTAAMSMYILVPIIIFLKHGLYVRTYPCLYPFSYEPGGLIHWLLYTLEAVGAICIWSTSIGVDCGFAMYSLQLCGELKILAKKFRELKLEKDYKEKLRDCIERHHVIINAKNRLEEAFGLISIWLAISGALVLCSLIFQISELLENKNSVLHMGHLCAQFLAKFLQIFMYAWYGNLVADESLAFLDAMYSSHWTDSCDTRFKNDILMVLVQKPLVLVAKGCMNVKLDMFAKIVKSSMSYFFLLQTLNADTDRKH